MEGDAASQDQTQESIPSQLGKLAIKQIAKADVAAHEATSKVRDATNKIIGECSSKVDAFNDAMMQTHQKISGAIDKAVAEAETKVRGITPELKSAGQKAIDTVKGKVDGLADTVHDKLNGIKDEVFSEARTHVEQASQQAF